MINKINDNLDREGRQFSFSNALQVLMIFLHGRKIFRNALYKSFENSGYAGNS